MDTATDLGYDPRPDITHWNGTPIPPVDRPLKITPERAAICSRVWWWGGPDIALRNCRHYIYHVIDYGTDVDKQFTIRDVPRETWIYALNSAKEGRVSRGGHTLFALWMGADPTISDGWRDASSRFDIRPRYTHAQWLERIAARKARLGQQ